VAFLPWMVLTAGLKTEVFLDVAIRKRVEVVGLNS
jgi:hypothetical protein